MAERPVIAVVVTYNGMAWVDRCFGSLRTSTMPVRTIAIDNGSTDGTPDHLRQRYPEVEVVQADHNLGFGQGNNLGLRKALDVGAEHVFLLNQDAWVLSDTIGALVQAMQADARWGVLSPVHLNGPGTALDNWFADYVAPAKCPGLLADREAGTVGDHVYPVAFVNAAAWMLSRRCLLTVGGFNPVFFHYGEDDEYLKRVAFHGLGVGVLPSAIIHHDRPQVASGARADDRAMRLRMLQLKYADPATALDPAVARRTLRRKWLHAVLRLQRSNARFALERLRLHGAADLDEVVRRRTVAARSGPSFLGS